MQSVADYHDLVRRDVFLVLPQRIGRVLDLGGGIGATAAALKADGRAESAVLFDQVATNPAPGIDAAVPVDLNDLARLNALLAEHGPFDTVLCLDVLEHLYDPWATVSAVHRALAPGGALVISLPNLTYIGLLGPLLLWDRFDYADSGIMDRTHIRWFTRTGAMALATGSGLRLAAITQHIFGWKKLLVMLSGGLLTRFFAFQHLIRVENPA